MTARKILRPVYWPIRRVVRFVLWAFPVLGNLLSPRAANGRRILAIYDTASQPFSVGDLLIFQEASLVLCQKHHVDQVDIAIVYDPLNPASSDPVFVGSITEDNVMYHLASILPIAQVNQRLGSLFIFNSHEHLQLYINDNANRYHVWPSGWKVATREYLNPVTFNDLLYSHYKEHGSIPYLSCRPFLKKWAENFYREHVHPQVPVTINIRNNKGWHPHRNSQLDCWIAFFEYCETRYPAKFVVICAYSEIDDRMRKCANVIIAKDYQTGVEQDLALIHASAMHMGVSSGPATMAWFSSNPYLIINTTDKLEFFEHPNMVKQVESNIQRFWFAGSLQRFVTEVESAELLIREFELMWEAVGLQYWESAGNVESKPGAELHTWLR